METNTDKPTITASVIPATSKLNVASDVIFAKEVKFVGSKVGAKVGARVGCGVRNSVGAKVGDDMVRLDRVQ